MYIPRVRFYLACCVLLALVFVWPEAALACWPVMFFLPGCACCPGCTIFSDDFSTDRTGTDYTVVSGSWSVSGGVLTTSSAGAPLIVSNTSGTHGKGRVIVSGKVDTSTARFRAIGAYTDSNNYLYADLTINGASSSLSLYQYVSGSLTNLATSSVFTTSTDALYTVELCWTGSHAYAITSAATSKAISAASTLAGNKAGIGASPAGGTATFEWFKFLEHKSAVSSCNSCGSGEDDGPVGTRTCGECLGDIGPATMDVELSGTTDGGPCAVGNCTNRDGLYIATASANCEWLFSSTACTCCVTSVKVTITFDATDYWLTVTVTDYALSGGGFATFKSNLGSSKPDCFGFSAANVPFVSQASTTFICNFAGATVLVSAGA